MKKTIGDSSDRTMVTFSSFLPLLNLSCTCFLAFLQILYLYNMYILGRVRSIVNYDKTYGIFLRGFANICAVSNSVIYDTALLW